MPLHLKPLVISGLVFLVGRSSKIPEPDKYYGFLQNYSDLTEATSPSGTPELRWISPQYNPDNYNNSVFSSIAHLPQASSLSRVDAQEQEKIRIYTENQLRAALAAHKPLESAPDTHCLIFSWRDGSPPIFNGGDK